MKSIASTSNISLAWYKKVLITIFAFNYGCPTICATDQRQVTKNSGHPLVVDQEAYTSLWTTNANRIFGMCDWSILLVLSCHLAEEFDCSPFHSSLFMIVSYHNPKMCRSTRMFTYCFFIELVLPRTSAFSSVVLHLRFSFSVIPAYFKTYIKKGFYFQTILAFHRSKTTNCTRTNNWHLN